jgi:hypothetical protein
MRNIEEISHDVFYGMEKYSQITIDYVEEAEDFINGEEEDRVGLGAFLYDLDLLLEVINPALEDDIKVLRELEILLESVI